MGHCWAGALQEYYPDLLQRSRRHHPYFFYNRPQLFHEYLKMDASDLEQCPTISQQDYYWNEGRPRKRAPGFSRRRGGGSREVSSTIYRGECKDRLKHKVGSVGSCEGDP